jgi:hypothetical protein
MASSKISNSPRTSSTRSKSPSHAISPSLMHVIQPNRVEAIRCPDALLLKSARWRKNTMMKRSFDNSMAKGRQAQPASPSRSPSHVGSGLSIASPARRFRSERLQSAKFVRDMASACESSTTGLSVALSQRCGAIQMHHTPSRLMTLLIYVCENGWQIPGIFLHTRAVINS